MSGDEPLARPVRVRRGLLQLGLLAVQGLALVGLLRWPPPAAPLGLTLFWLASSTLLLGLSLRCCWDRPGVSAVPWFAVHSTHTWGQVTALSEEGLEARLTGSQIPTQHWGLPLELVQDSASQPYLSWITLFWITMFGGYG